MERTTWNMRQCRTAMTLERWEAVKPPFFFLPLTNIDAGLVAYLDGKCIEKKRPDSNAVNATCIRVHRGTPVLHVKELSASRRQVSWNWDVFIKFLVANSRLISRDVVSQLKSLHWFVNYLCNQDVGAISRWKKNKTKKTPNFGAVTAFHKPFFFVFFPTPSFYFGASSRSRAVKYSWLCCVLKIRLISTACLFSSSASPLSFSDEQQKHVISHVRRAKSGFGT